MSLPRTASHPSTYAAPPPPIPPPPPSYPSQSRSSYRDPAPIEVYTLPDSANASIPPEIRNQFKRDENGRVLFFTAPPVYVADSENNTKKPFSHSISYLANQTRREAEISRKRKAYEEAKYDHQLLKKARKFAEIQKTYAEMQDKKFEAFKRLEAALVQATEAEMKAAYGDEKWKDGLDAALVGLAKDQKLAEMRRKVMDLHAKEEIESRVSLRSNGVLVDEVE